MNMWLSKGVQLKREGKLLEALKCYVEAMKVDSSNSAIYTSTAKVFYLLNKRDDAIMCYSTGIYLAIKANRQVILSIYDISNKEGRLDLLDEFFNSTYHAGHAFIDLDSEQVNILGLAIEYKNPHLTKQQVKDIIIYNIKSYIHDVSGEFCPAPEKIQVPEYDFDFDGFYTYLGKQACMQNIDWDELM